MIEAGRLARIPWRRLQLAALAAVAALAPFYRFGVSAGGQTLAPHELLLLVAAGLCTVGWVVQRDAPPPPGVAPHPPAPSPARGRGGDPPNHPEDSAAPGNRERADRLPLSLINSGAPPFGPPQVVRERGPGGEGLRGEGFGAYDRPIALFLAAALLSLLATQYLRLSLRELRTLIVEPLLFWYLCRLTVRDVRDVVWLVAALLASTSVVAVIGLGQLALGGAVTEVQGVRRVLGTYSSPNHFALLLGRALPFLLAIGWSLPRWRPWAAGGFLLCAAALGATFSVGGWLGTGLALLVVVGLLGGKRLLLGLILAGVVAGAIIFVAAPVERLAGRLDPRQGTSFVRVQLWQAAGQLVAEAPLLGIGLDNFLYRYPALMPEGTIFEPNLSHPHNVVLQFWLQLGLPGLVALGWLLWRFWQQIRPAAIRDAPPDAPGPPQNWMLARALAVGALGSMTDFVAHGMVDNSYFLPDMAIIFWLTLAVAAVVAQGRWRENSH